MRRAFSTILLVLAGLLAGAATASAHAVLESSTPVRGAQLKQAPSDVTFTFNEPVEASLGAVRVFNTEGSEVQDDELERPGGDAETVGASLPAELPEGLYTATYRVVSADAHPISGGITFTVGNPARGEAGFVQGKTISELLAESDTGKVTEVAFWADRWIGYLAIAVAFGAIAWMLLIWLRVSGVSTEGRDRALRRFRQLVIPAAIAGLIASLLAIIFQGAVGSGTDFWNAFGSGIPGEVIQTRYGTLMLLRAAAWLVLLGLVLFGSRGFTRLGITSVSGAFAGLVLAATPAFAGHAATRDPSWLLVPSDLTHVIAMAVWTGGLAAMLWILPAATRTITDPPARTGVLTDATSRFSALALVAVTLIGVSGAVQAIIEVGSIGALFETQFGRAVAIKIVLFSILIGLGAANRMRVIPGLVKRLDRSESPGPAGQRLRLNLRIEALLVIAVLGVSAALVSYPPPDSIQSGPESGYVVVEGKRVDYTIDPGRVGSNEIHIYVSDDASGAPAPVMSMEVTFALPESDIAPIEAEARRAGPGHFVVPSAMLGVKGEWLAEAAIRLSEFEEPIAGFEVDVR